MKDLDLTAIMIKAFMLVMFVHMFLYVVGIDL